MKILFTQDTLGSAGAERSHLDILSRFSADTESCFVYFYPKHDLKGEYERAGLRLYFLDIPETYNFHLAISRLVKLIHREKPDLLISCLWRADIISRFASIITGVPLVGTLVNDTYSPIALSEKNGLKYKIVYWIDRLAAGIPVHWIANAQSIADSHIKTLGIKKEKISVIYRGRSVPETCWKPGAEIRKFISYGRLLERKGFQEAIPAFSKVVKQYPNCTLTIYGEGPFRAHLENQISELGLKEKVILPGKISDPHCLLQLPTAHCFIFPSWYEGFSGALVEAMMAGIPIIASDISMNLEAVTENENALIFPFKDVKGLTKKMIFAIENPDLMAKIGNAARLQAIERFDIEKIAKDYEEVLNYILKK